MSDQQEALEERAAIIQFCSGREMTRDESERIAAKQLKMDSDSVFKGRWSSHCPSLGGNWW
jgi:hypothetical protein